MKNFIGSSVAAKALLWLLIIAMDVMLLTRCTVTKHVQKSDQSNSTKTEAQAEEKTKKETQSDLTSKTTTTELLDTTVNLAGGNLNGSRPLTDLEHGKPLILEDNNQAVKISVDSSGNVKVESLLKPRNIPVKIKKTTQREEQLKQTVKSSSDSTGKENIQTKSELKTVDRQVTKYFGFPWWLWLLIAGIAFLIWKLWPKIRVLIGL